MQSQSFVCGFCYRNVVTRQVFSENIFFFPCLPGIKSLVLQTNLSVVLGMDNIPVRGNSPTKTYSHSTTRIQKMVLGKIKKIR